MCISYCIRHVMANTTSAGGRGHLPRLIGRSRMKPQKCRVVEWKNEFCAIRFRTTAPPGEPLDFADLLRFREPITRSKRTVRGKVPDYAHRCMQHGESHNEVRALQVLVASAHADVLKVQPLQLVYGQEGKTVHYVPDILLVWDHEIWAIDVKEDSQVTPAAEEQFATVEKLFAKHDVHFLVWPKSAICGEPRFSNAQDLLDYQCCVVSPSDRERIRRTFAEQNNIRLRNLTNVDLCNVLSLVVSGMLFINWWQRLSEDSIVSVAPFGRQEWPNDRSAAARFRARGRR